MAPSCVAIPARQVGHSSQHRTQPKWALDSDLGSHAGCVRESARWFHVMLAGRRAEDGNLFALHSSPSDAWVGGWGARGRARRTLRLGIVQRAQQIST